MGLVITTVRFTKAAEKDLKVVPEYVVEKLQAWQATVQLMGLEETRKIPGYHDEPLKGKLKGMRSIRLSLNYRAYYRIVHEKVEIAEVTGVDRHKYR